MDAIVSKQQLIDVFRKGGLSAGDSVIIHSSFRSLGAVDGGPETVIDALLAVIGRDGNLMLPTFNYSSPAPEPYYNPVQTPCRTGVIPEIGWHHPGAVRSLHPTHSVAVIGPRAEELTRDHLSGRTFGIGSPIDRLAEMGGKVLLVGVGHVANTTIHVGEEHAGVPKAPWTDKPVAVNVLMPGGTIRKHLLDTSSSCSAAFGAVEGRLRRYGEIRDMRLGGCLIQLIRGRDVIRRTCELIREQPDILLCRWQDCKPCVGARRHLDRDGLHPVETGKSGH